MKAKDRRKLERQAEQIRREMGLPQLDIKQLLSVDAFRTEILRAAEIAEKQTRKGGDQILR